jgi:hypothetical protein
MRVAHVYKEIDGRRVLLGIGEGVTITPGAPEPPAGDMIPRAAESLPPSLTAIDAALAAGPLGREAGLATWAHTRVRRRLRHGLSEELPSVDRLVGHYGVDLRGLLDRLATGGLRCEIEGQPAAITPAQCAILRAAADVLATSEDALATAWTARVEHDVASGWEPTSALELLDLDAVVFRVGLEFDSFVFATSPDPAPATARVLLRAAAAICPEAARSPTDPHDARIALLDEAARIIAERRPSVGPGRRARPGDFLAEIRATVRMLRTIHPRTRRPGRPRLAVERAVAVDLITFLLGETKQKFLGHAAVFLSIICPALAGWREKALSTVRERLMDDVTLDAATRAALGDCRPDALGGAARTWYIADLSARLRSLLGRRLLRSLRRRFERRHP